MFSLDSFLKVYPNYFYDSSYAVRQQNMKSCINTFKRAAGLLIYFEPELTIKGGKSFQFQKVIERVFLVLYQHWLFTGPIGNEPAVL